MGRVVLLAAAGIAGAALGAATMAGAALLLVAGEGALATAGFLLALALGSVAAALWVGEAAERPARSRGRWFGAVAVFVVAAIFAELWGGAGGAGSALAVLFLLAAPAYAVASLLAALSTRGAGVPVAALAGAAVGVLAAALLLIPKLDPEQLFLGGATLLLAAGWVEIRWAAPPARREGGGMRGKVVLITGVGGRGQVGYALAEAFLAEGARVAITGLGPEVEAHARELAGRGEAVGLAADLTRAEEAERVVAAARERFGRLDVVVNAAGGLSVIKSLGETTPEEWERELERNARTTFLVSRAALPLLRESRGSIVNFASPAGLRARARLGAYSAAKAAVVALTRALALEEREHGVRANAVAPGMIDTEQNRRAVEDPERVKWVTREEVARVVVFLASDASSGISGETIQVLGEGVES